MFSRTVKCLVCSTLALALGNSLIEETSAENIEARSLRRADAEDAAPPASLDNESVRKAMELFEDGQFEDAVEILRSFTADNADSSPAEMLIAQWFAEAKQASQARVWLDRAARNVPSDPDAYVALASINLNERRWTEAKLLFEKAAQLTRNVAGTKRELPTKQRILAGLAGVAQAEEDWETAEKRLEELISRQATPNARAWQMLGRVLFHQGRPADALEKLRRAKEIDDEMLTPEVVLAGWCQQTGDEKGSEKWIGAALQKDGEALPTRLAAANTFLRGEQFEAAAAQAEAALELDPSSFEAKLLRGNVALLSEQYDTASQVLEQAAIQSPGNLSATNNLALALCEGDEKQCQRALEYAEMNARRFPTNPDTIGTLGWVLYKSGRKDEAKTVLKKVIDSGAESPPVGCYWAQMLADSGRAEEASLVLRNSLRKSKLFHGRARAERLLDELNGNKQGPLP